jgi:hypothetical protein
VKCISNRKKLQSRGLLNSALGLFYNKTANETCVKVTGLVFKNVKLRQTFSFSSRHNIVSILFVICVVNMCYR